MHDLVLMKLGHAGGVFKLGGDSLIEGTSVQLGDGQPAHADPTEQPCLPSHKRTGSAPEDLASAPVRRSQTSTPPKKQGRLVRPENLKDLDG